MAFYSKQLHAAYISDQILQKLETFSDGQKANIKRMYKYAGTYECILNFSLKELGQNSRVRLLAMVAQNIVQRGIPTFAPKIIEDALPEETREITYENLAKSLMFLDDEYRFDFSRRYYQKNYNGTVTSGEVNNTEIGFLTKISEDENLGFLSQLMEPQKPFEHIIIDPNTEARNYTNYTRYCLDLTKEQILQAVKDQRLDFSLELPRLSQNKHCVAIELDGPTHEEMEQQAKDKMRGDILHELYWMDTVRIRDVKDENSYRNQLIRFAKPYIDILNNATAPALASVQVPIFVARVASMILMLVESGELPVYGGKEITISVEECTHKKSICYGVQNAYNILYHLSKILGGESREMASAYIGFPDGELYEIQPNEQTPRMISSSGGMKRALLYLHENMTRRLYDFNPGSLSGHHVWLYSAYGLDSVNRMHFGKPLSYEVADDSVSSLCYFLQDIFHKPNFRPKQFEIVQAALRRKNVIGILPTGSGKTITYQLSAILQPGIGMIIAPLISLMEDQVANLHRYCIDSTVAINSTVHGADKRLLLNRCVNKEVLFLYIAPERLQIASFKELLHTLPIFTLVMDEAHCVSQWGHDFRTAYLRVGDTMEKYLDNYITMALTGTASCNVVTDIKRELNMQRNVSIVKPNNFRRPELHFEIIEQEEDWELDERLRRGCVEDAIALSVEYLSKLPAFQKTEDGSLEQFFRKENGQYVNCGLIFCPFAKKKNASVESLYGQLTNNRLPTELYKYTTVDMYHGQLRDTVKKEAQNRFTEGKTGVLVATKAFGMGIDKPNIRFTIHTTVPESIESFYQEAGRAGRDRQDAVNYIIAPPIGIRYENIIDKSIFDFFIKQSFPDRDSFLEQIDRFLAMSYITTKTMEETVLEDLTSMDISEKEVSITTNRQTGMIELHVQAGKGNCQYQLQMDEDKQVTFQNDSERTSKEMPFFYKKYLADIQNVVANKLGTLKKVKPEYLPQSFLLSKQDKMESLSDVFDRLKGNEETTCYVGLDSSFLANWIDAIVRALIQEKKEAQGEQAELVLDKDLLHAVIDERKVADKTKPRWKYKPEKFYDIYCRIREQNRLPEVDLPIYCEFAQEIQPKWKGAFTGVQDKALYYLGLLGVYENFEREYGTDYVKIRVKAVHVDDLKDHVRKFIGSYETSDYVKRRVNLDWLDAVSTPARQVREALGYIINYSYDKIRQQRQRQGAAMYACIQDYDGQDDQKFSDSIYRYFESKYSDDLLQDVEHETLNLPIQWINKITEAANQGENLLDDLSHLRTSALKVEESRPQSFTPYFLYAYATFRDHNLDIRSGIDSFLTGYQHITKLRSNYRTTVQRLCEMMFETEDVVYLDEVEKIIQNEYKKEAKKLKYILTIVQHNLQIANS